MDAKPILAVEANTTLTSTTATAFESDLNRTVPEERVTPYDLIIRPASIAGRSLHESWLSWYAGDKTT